MEVMIERCCWPGRASGDGGGVLLIGAPGVGRQGSAHVPTMTRDLKRARLAEGGGRDPRRHGEHRRLLAAGLCRAGRALRARRRQRPAHQERAGAQDRREGRRVDRRAGAPRADPQELRAAASRCASCATCCATAASWSRGQAAERNRLLKLLETANIKLASVASDVFGVSGRAMLQGADRGRRPRPRDGRAGQGPLRTQAGRAGAALEGRIEEHHRFLLAMQLRRLEAAEHDIAALDQRIDEKLEPYRPQHRC